MQFLGQGAPPWPYEQIDPFTSAEGCRLSMVTQCELGYLPLLRRAARVWNNDSYENTIRFLPGYDNLSGSVFDLLLPALKLDDASGLTNSSLLSGPIIEWLSPTTGPNETLWISGSHLNFANATLCLSDTNCVHHTRPSAEFARWPSQMRLQVPGKWSLARYSLSISLASVDGTYRSVHATVNAPVVHWWLSSELGASVKAGGWVRVFGDSLALDTIGCVDPRSPRTGASTTLRLSVRCGGPESASVEVETIYEDCHSAEFRVPTSMAKPTSTSCTMLLKTGDLPLLVPLRGNLTLLSAAPHERMHIHALPGNASDFRRILTDDIRNSVVQLSGVYHMSDTSLTVPAGVDLVGPAELVYLSSSWLPGTTCLLGQLGSTAPAWALNNVTITIAANLSCNTADGLDTPANAMVCMGGTGSSVLHSTIQSVRAPDRQFCHLFHASVSKVRPMDALPITGTSLDFDQTCDLARICLSQGASDLSVTNSHFDLRMAVSQRALPRVLSIDNCSRVLIEANTMYSDAEGWIISSSNMVQFTKNLCNSSISDGRHGNTLGTYHPP